VSEEEAAATGIGKLDELNGKSFALVAVEESGEGACFVGTARWDGTKLFFERPGMLEPIEIPEHRVGSVARTPPELGHLIEADYFVRLTIGNLPEDVAPGEYTRVGLKWPGEGRE
jgi:hypothetical protein